VTRCELPARLLVLARSGSADVQAEARGIGRDAEDAEWKPHLGRPAARVAGDGGVPGRIPVGRELDIVVEEAVQLLTGRVYREPVAGPAIALGIEGDRHGVRLDGTIPAGELEDRGVGLIADDADIEGVVIPEDAEARRGSGNRTLLRLGLPKPPGFGRVGPR